MNKLSLPVVVILLGMAAATSSQASESASQNDNPVVQRLLAETRAASRNWMDGDAAPYAALMAHTRQFTIFGPLGGLAALGWSDEFAAAQIGTARQFQGATASTIDLVQAHVTDTLIVLVTMERNMGRIAGSEPQQWDLRVTQVYELANGQWKVVHRHADPLVVRRNLAQTVQLFHP